MIRRSQLSKPSWASGAGKGAALALALFALGNVSAQADQVIADDLIVDGSACVGFDCVNGESFGFDTIRMKENNLRIKAQDTSTGTFPTGDWYLIFNDTTNGGSDHFSIQNIDTLKTPFRIEAGARDNALTVDNTGHIGLGTITPVTQIHTKDGNTPTLRLEQDGSSGFTAQTWDMAGNETNFFIRDATNGSTLPFRIRPGAPTSSIDIESTKVVMKTPVEIGTSTANQTLTVYGEVNVASDGRLKEGIATIGRALQLVSSLDGRQFFWKPETGTKSNTTPTLGFIAQEVEAVVPSLVSEAQDGTKTVNYMGVIPILVNALKEQQSQIERLQAQLDDQGKRLTELADDPPQ